MTKTARLYKIEQLIRHRGSVSFAQLLAALEVSPATLKRDLRYLREQLGTPVEYDAFDRTYHVAETARRTRRELPGLRDPDRFDAWLHRLLVNSCLDQVRRRRRRPISIASLNGSRNRSPSG